MFLADITRIVETLINQKFKCHIANLPACGCGQIDWTATSGDKAILHKPILAAVGLTGDYNDLINKPTGNTGGGTDSGYSFSNENFTI